MSIFHDSLSFCHAPPDMTSNEARKIDQRLKKLTDEELTEDIRLLEELADLVLEDYFEGVAGDKQPRVSEI